MRKLRVNERITVPTVRAIGDKGEQLGIVATVDAIKIAQDAGMDLVEVAPDATPPVCRIMDYGRYKFQQEKRQATGKKHQATVTLKEIKLRPKTGEHDFMVKANHIRQFLEKGHKVKVTVMFRGREIVHSELGQKHLERILEMCGDLCAMDAPPKMEGRSMHMLLSPAKKH
ncbi:MAG: translation initiation factor IF-3 [Deltaproteobacteria bacterium]|nr:translation initiation factor IF-3 [Deltaproteobacteria bacterium]